MDTSYNQITVEQEHALVLLIKAMLEQVDEIVALQKRGHSAQLSRTLLKEMASVLPSLEEPLQLRYFDLLTTIGTNQLSPHVRGGCSPEYVLAVEHSKRSFINDLRSNLLKQVA